jgi:hypothetical protein
MAQVLKDEKTTTTASRHANEPSGWVGWVYFAGLMMMLVGVFQLIAGLVAIFRQSVFFVTNESLIVFNYAQWGWIHLLIGLLLLFSSFGVFRGSVWGRSFGSFLAGLSAIANFLLIPVHPIWSLVVIGLDVMIIYALLVHGSEVREDTRY